MDRESAEKWNAKPSKGTIVSVSLRRGETLSAATTKYPQQLSDLALVTLSGVYGYWKVGAL